VLVSLALVVGGAGLTVAPKAVAAAPPAFASSFESADPVALQSAPYGPQTNVTGIIPPGSVNSSVTKVTASAENPPGEVATNLLDGNPGSKWLAFATTAWITYSFDTPVVATDYVLTSANDAPERDPKSWTVDVSDDGATWSPVDTQTNQAFTSRGQTHAYPTTNSTAHRYYRLSITANNGSNLSQLADWDLRDARKGDTPMLAKVLGGPSNGLNSKPGVGFTGTHSLRYGGSNLADGPASATDVLYDGLQQPVGKDTELSYLIFPDDSKDLARPSGYAAVDIVLDDGSRLFPKTNLVDANGFGVTARAHGEQKSLFMNQWNSVHIDLGSLAGRTVQKILLSYDYPSGKAGTAFSGWVDDVRIGAGAPAVDGSSRVNYVDTRRGTLSNDKFSRGTNIPAAAMPNGFNFFTPMTNAGGSNLEYEYQRANNAANLPTLQAIGISHEPSIWMGDRDRLAVMPSTSATPVGDPTARAVPFTHADETARPDLYQVKLANGMTAAITPTDHGGIYRFTFPGTTGSVVVDKVNHDSSLHVAADGTVSGWVDGGDGSGITRMFVSGAFDTAPSSVGTTADRGSAQYASFTTSPGGSVQLRLATSFISLDQAHRNLDLEVTGRSFEQVDQGATTAWNSRLGVIDVQGATANQLTTLYGSLYRMNLYPNSQFENVGTAAAPKFQHASPVAPVTGAATDTATNAKIVDGELYVNNGFWDTYRTVWPLYSQLYPATAAKLVDGFVQQYREGGWIARWSSPGYSDLMTGTSSDAAFANAYISGAVPTATALQAYDAAVKNATVVPPFSAVGRKALDQSIFLGYTPDTQGESVSWGMEGYINDHAIGLMAAKLAKDRQTPKDRRERLERESAYFLDRSQNYVQMFDPKTGFFRPKTVSGAVAGGSTFDPTAWWGPYTETDGWNFAFHVPQDIAGLEALYGGSAGLVKKLDEFFATPETGGNGDIHEMVEARAVRMGQLGMSNQPSHHIPYLYAAAGAPSKTQAVVREIEQRLFVGSEIGQGYLGDEDNGEMSSWYIFSALGFYPLAPASGEYQIGSPLFTKATVHLQNGKDLVIEAPGNTTGTPYVGGVKVNGQKLDTTTLPQRLISDGGTVRFTMSATPTSWGTSTASPELPAPRTDITKAGYGTVSVSDKTAAAALTDDTSRTATTFATPTPQITWKSASGPVAVGAYTLTSGPSGAAPKAWHLEGSQDGVKWKLLDTQQDQAFTWQLQTRPFELRHDRPFSYYRLTIDATSSGAPATVAELELLATPGTSGPLLLTPATGVTGTVGASVSDPLATLSGGRGKSPSSYTATADFQDGKGPQPATLTQTPLGTWTVTSAHVFGEAGEYPVIVSASDGKSQVSAVVTVSISRDTTLVGAFDTVCIGDAGVGANCDAKNWAFDRARLAASGFVQGKTVPVPGTALSFDLPAIPAGQPDDATGNGRTIRLDPGTGATRLSVIGTATESAQHVTGTLTFNDGSTASLPIDFGDWVGAAKAPISGNIVVGTSNGRLNGATGGDGQTAAIYGTAPYAIPAGKTVVSLTLPLQTGDPGSAGRIHVFAVASDGTRAPAAPLTVTRTAVPDQKAGAAFTADVATVSGGIPATPGAYTARINWGDGSPLVPATVKAGANGTWVVSGGHTYAQPGDYPVTVTVDDGAQSAATTTAVHVISR